MQKVLLFLILFFNLPYHLTFSQNAIDPSTQETAISELIAQYLATREQNDKQALLALLTEDIDQLTTSGNLRSGPDDVSSGSLASTRNNSGLRAITIEKIRFIRPDVAIVNALYDITNREDAPDLHYLTSIIAVMEDGRWKISAIRNMQPSK